MLMVIFYMLSVIATMITLFLVVIAFVLLFEGEPGAAFVGIIFALFTGGITYVFWKIAKFFELLSSPYTLREYSLQKSLSSQEKTFLENFLPVQKNLLQLYDEILQDQKIKNYIKENSPEVVSKNFIYHCLVYDIAVLAKKLYGEQILQKPKPAFAIFVIGDILIEAEKNKPQENFLQENSIEELQALYKKTMQQHLQKKFYEAVASVVDLANEENPVHLESPTNGLLFSEKNFSLNPLLHLIESSLFESYANALYRFALFLAKSDDYLDKQEETVLQKIQQLLHNPFSLEEMQFAQIKNDKEKISATEKSKKNELVQNNEKVLQETTLQETMEELNQLIGLQKVKEEINTLINFIQIQKERESSGLKTTQVSYHIVFTGNPGTGKTTVARLVAQIYKALGILSQGHLHEVDRANLIASYQGQTSAKVDKAMDDALNGILFIDEAYALVQESQDSYGKEAVATIIKRMEDDREKLAVILAGYTNEMHSFIETNPGFRSRFNRYIDFPDYTPQELLGIFELQCKKAQYVLTNAAQKKLTDIFELAYQKRDRTFGNGRLVRNLFEKAVENQANRISKLRQIDKDILMTLQEDDIEE